MPKTAAAASPQSATPAVSAAGKTAPKKSSDKIVQITSSKEFFAHGTPVLYRIGGSGPKIDRRNTVTREVKLAKRCDIFADVSRFVPCFIRIECKQVSGAGEGRLTTYACPTLLRPLELLQLICQMDDSKRELNGNDYTEFLMRNGMTFSLTQVEDVLSSPKMWGSLNLEGRANVFFAHQDGKLYFILAYRCKHRSLWFVRDSLFLRGRGCNPDALYHFRNPVPELK